MSSGVEKHFSNKGIKARIVKEKSGVLKYTETSNYQGRVQLTGPKPRGEVGSQCRGLRSRSYFRKGSSIREEEVGQGGRKRMCTDCEWAIHKREKTQMASEHTQRH